MRKDARAAAEAGTMTDQQEPPMRRTVRRPPRHHPGCVRPQAPHGPRR